MSLLPSSNTCCEPCEEPTSVAVPGPQGDAGTDGTDGADGVSAFTYVASESPGAQPVMPAEGGTVTVNTTTTTAFLNINQYVNVAFWGTLKVYSIPSSTSLILLNPEVTATGLYADNAPPGTSLPALSKITCAGEQGPAGADGASGAPDSASYITQTPNASLTSEQALSLLGTGLMKNTTGTGVVSIVTQGVADTNVAPVDAAAGLTNGDAVFATAAGLETQTASDARTSLGLGTMAVQDAGAVAISGGTVTGITDITVADGGTGASTAAAARVNLGVLAGYGLLGSVTAADLNVATSDNNITMLSSRYRIDHVTLESPSAAVTTATAGLFTAAGGGGTTLCADQALSGTLTSTAKFMNLVEQAVVGTDTLTSGTLYFRVGTPEGSARTVNVKIYGWKFD
jgi:hypothetical protein